MSRGGGGGRGGGRGGRGGRGGAGGRSMTQDLIRDNMEDLGLDSFQLVDDRIPPPLYPDTHIPVPNPLTDEDSFAVQKMREISHRLQMSPYYLTRKVEQNDIDRYTDRYRKSALELSLSQCINTSAVDASRYVPSELLDGKPLGGRITGSSMTAGEDRDSITKRESQKRKREKDALQMLEKAEAGGVANKDAAAAGGGEKKEGAAEDEEGLDAEEQPDEFEMDDDYGVDHYASDDGGGGGDDDEEAVY